MATIVFVHAHPDDEASQTSGSMARAVALGDRVVCVYATNGDHGMAAEGLGDVTVSEHRRREAEASARVIGTQRVEWLGYADSGMRGWPQNDAPDAFMRADLHHAALKLAAILDSEGADFVVGYDWHGNYGHPDHVMVHRVTRRAADLARRRPRYLEATSNFDAALRQYEAAAAAGFPGFDPRSDSDDGHPVGTPEAELTWRVDVTDLLDVKRAALACHASQTADAGMMLALPSDVFATAFGHEYYIDPAVGGPMRDGWPFGPEGRSR